jgi:hypothetical protein
MWACGRQWLKILQTALLLWVLQRPALLCQCRWQQHLQHQSHLSSSSSSSRQAAHQLEEHGTQLVSSVALLLTWQQQQQPWLQ